MMTDDGQVICPDPECGQTQDLPPGGALVLKAPREIVKTLAKLKCADCGTTDTGTVDCSYCESKTCTSCRQTHDRGAKCDVLKLTKEIKKLAPNDEVQDAIQEKAALWTSLEPVLPAKREQLNAGMDKLMDKLHRLRLDTLERLTAFEERIKEKLPDLEEIRVSHEFADSTRKYVSRSHSSDDTSVLNDDCQKLIKLLPDIDTLLDNGPDKIVDELEQLINNVDMFNKILEEKTVKSTVETQTDQNNEQQTAGPDQPADCARRFNRLINPKDHVPNIGGVFDIARSPVTGNVFVTGMIHDNESIPKTVILVYDENLAFKKCIDAGVRGISFACIDVNEKGELLVSHYNQAMISFMTEEGDVIKTVDSKHKCWHAVEDDNGLLYVSHHDDNCVVILDQTGNLLCRIGLGQLQSPEHLTIFGENLYVSDVRTNQVCVYTKSGELVKTIRPPADSVLKSVNPTGTYIDNDRVFLCDFNNACVHVFDSHGHHQGVIRGRDHEMKSPVGITVTRRGEIIVASKKFTMLFVSDPVPEPSSPCH